MFVHACINKGRTIWHYQYQINKQRRKMKIVDKWTKRSGLKIKNQIATDTQHRQLRAKDEIMEGRMNVRKKVGNQSHSFL